MRQRQAQADPLGLARDERLAQGIGQLGRRPRAAVGHIDGDLVAVHHRLEPYRAARSRGLDRVQRQVQQRGPHARRVDEDLERPLACAVREADPGVLARRVDQEGDLRDELAEVAGLRRPPLDLPEREQPLDLLLGHRQLPQGDAQALVAGRAGWRRAWSCTLIRAPVSEFRS